ncbi:transcriptional regulator [Anaerosporomusa subterranea]|uniref:siroheme decarboxylase n=1 Tax=Anaerosporomusa subterranea TaxID=1794912 RepID=A0A154BRY1_ANASB|nr:Lrp/AsnC family transcriptional regulator [Anaerosporomusa subterranea]KYZ76764.1 transcriptional regulator [Anaerosporomusa subterranea]
MFDSLDTAIIAAMQVELTLTEEPYQKIAQSLGISQEELLTRLQGYRNDGKIRKLGAVLRHRKVGFSANALCAWIIPMERLDEVGIRLAAEPYISHCYARESHPDWPYNLYTMLHAHSRAECEASAQELSRLTGITDYVLLYSHKEWKKTSMRYFSENGR